MTDQLKLSESKEQVRKWAVLLLRALPECEDVEESVLVANLALENLPPSAELAISETKEQKGETKVHKFASTQFNLEDAAWSRDEDPLPKIRHMARQIDAADLAEDGREDHPHITVKYGIHTEDADEIAMVVKDFGPVQVTLGKTFIFPGEEHDVVNVEVKSPALVRLNKLISDSLECTDTHPEYVPHICLAYVKSGMGEKYAGIGRVDGMRLTFQDLIFSDKRRELVDCRLALEPPPPSASLSVEDAELSVEKKKDSGKGRWITIGAKDGHGGSPVYIENGRITKGAPSLAGKKIGALKEESDSTHRQDLHRERDYKRAVHAKTARKAGIDKESLHQLAGEMKAHHDSHIADVKSMLQDTRNAAQKMGVPIHHKQLSETGDHTKIPGFDTLARSLAGRYPHLLGAHGYSHNESADVDAEEASEKLLDFLKTGNPTPMHEDDAYEQALDYLTSQKQPEREPGEEENSPRRKSNKTSDEPIPFSLDAFFAHDIENRKAQSILNRTVAISKKLTQSARKDLSISLRTADPYELSQALLKFIGKYRAQLADLLTTTQLASLLEGAREVAKSIPIIPNFPNVTNPPATLEPERALELLDRLREMDTPAREEAIYNLPPDQQTFARQGLLAQQQGGEPPVSGFVPQTPPSGEAERVHYPIIDEAARELSQKNVMTREQFDRLDSAARQKAFTVAQVESLETMNKIRDVMAETVKDGVDVETFRERILEAVDEGTFMSDAHLENVYRTNVQTAFSDGQMAVLQHPFVRSGFPYASYEAIDDDRVEPDHLALMTLGIGGTNIYRLDDPVFMLFRPPWRWCCRCGWIPMTIRQAARHGIEEAKIWMQTGIEPVEKAFVKMPDFRPPAGFVRSLSGAPLSIQLSCVSMEVLSPQATVKPMRKPTGKKKRRKIDARMSVVVVDAMFAQVHSPVGGVTIGGEFYPGGQWIPEEAMAKASAEEKAPLKDTKTKLARTFKNTYPGADPNEPEKVVLHVPGIQYALIQGSDKEFADDYHVYMSDHLDHVRDKLEEIFVDEDMSEEDAAEKAEELREQVEGHVEHFRDVIVKHHKLRFGSNLKYAGEEDFKARVWNATTAIDEAVEEKDVDALYEAISDLQSEMSGAEAEFSDKNNEEYDAIEEAAQEQEDADKEEISEWSFDDIQSEVEGELGDDATQDQIDKVWRSTIQGYNADIAEKFPDKPYRVSLNEDGDLEMVHEEDLDDEFKPVAKDASLGVLDAAGHAHKGEGEGGGQFTSTGEGGAALEKKSPAKKVASAIGTAHDYIHHQGSAAFKKLPAPVQKAVSTVVGVAFTGWTASQNLAERISIEKGATPEEAAKVRSVLAAADLVAFKPVAMASAFDPTGTTAIASWVVPPVTAAYLVHSTVRHPLATFRAAKGIIGDFLKGAKEKVAEHTQEL